MNISENSGHRESPPWRLEREVMQRVSGACPQTWGRSPEGVKPREVQGSSVCCWDWERARKRERLLDRSRGGTLHSHLRKAPECLCRAGEEAWGSRQVFSIWAQRLSPTWVPPGGRPLFQCPLGREDGEASLRMTRIWTALLPSTWTHSSSRGPSCKGTRVLRLPEEEN